MQCDFFLMYKEVKVPCHMTALMLEHWSRVYLFERLFLFRSPLLEVLTRPCCGFKQRLGNFRETWYPDPAESSRIQQPQGTHGLLSSCSAEVLNRWLASSYVRVLDALLR